MEFAYTRVSTQTQTDHSQEADILQSFPSIEIYRDVCSGTIPANDRTQLSRLLDKLRKGDKLVVWWIDRLGRDYQDSESVIRNLLASGITIRTINQNLVFEYTGDDIRDMTTNIQITMITAMAAAERKNRLASAEAGRQAIKQNPELWAKKFQGRKRDQDRTTKIIELLESGMSIRKVAFEIGCNPSTVQRAKKLMSMG
ncbi:recombinase family protein [Photobacterium rosenbergii]|uniref:recombinase family protein n=1 Tax=Photobacterium rosenbergii TaxID=294936 RepID=UPI001C994900|nr:recombinase family protein [Photobacterium rosenbergii]MBY5948776.1 recombinase family protein [Photobacterium rosenbergii]